jgi:hypothetical protein
MKTRSCFSVRLAFITALAGGGLLGCMRPPSDPPGVEQQPVMHPERSPATQHTVPPDPNAIPAAESPDDPDSLGTTRTPPAAPALPMDQRPEEQGATGESAAAQHSSAAEQSPSRNTPTE